MRLTDYDKLQLKLRAYADKKAANGEIELANGILKAKCFIDQECEIINEKQLNGGWIPFKAEYDEDYNMYMLQGEIPDDAQEILVTDGKSVWSDTFMRDGMECYLDSGDDLIITVKAWMKLPEPYKEADNEVYI